MRFIYLALYSLLYNQLAWAYDCVSWAVSLGRWDSWRRAALPFVQGEQVLEVGFGTGALLCELDGGRRRVFGLEPSAAMQRISARKLGQRGQTVPRLQGTAQRLPFVDRAFDTIVTTFPASFILDKRAHREFARCLRPGGRLIVVEVVLSSRQPLLRFFFQLLFPSPPGAPEQLGEAFQAAELKSSEHLIGEGAVRPLVFVAMKQDHR